MIKFINTSLKLFLRFSADRIGLVPMIISLFQDGCLAIQESALLVANPIFELFRFRLFLDIKTKKYFISKYEEYLFNFSLKIYLYIYKNKI